MGFTEGIKTSLLALARTQKNVVLHQQQKCYTHNDILVTSHSRESTQLKFIVALGIDSSLFMNRKAMK